MLRLRFAPLAAALVLVSCGSPATAPDPGPPPPVVPASLSALSGNAQSGPAGAKLAEPLVVRVLDASGRPVAGAAVSWAITAGGGSLTAASATTDADGRVQAEWLLGTQVGSAAAAATVGSLPPVAFAATVRAAKAAVLAKVHGDGQNALAGALLSEPLQVKVTDAFGNPVQNQSVAWAVTAGGGSVGPSLSQTDSAGIARTRWSIGAGGANAATAVSEGAPAVTFSATAEIPKPVPSEIRDVSGSGQSALPGVKLPQPLVARVADQYGAPVEGVTVTWRVAWGTGTLVVENAVTDREGLSRASLTLGTTGDYTNTIAASAVGKTAVFSVRTISPYRFEIVSGNGQTGPVGVELPQALVVRYYDVRTGPIAGGKVTWLSGSNAGPVTPSVTFTDANGLTSARLTPGAPAGTKEVFAHGPSGVVTFTITATN